MEEFKNLPWKDWVPAIIAGGATVFAGVVAAMGKLREMRVAKRTEMLRVEREQQRTMEMTQTEDLTNRLRILMEGYENRIRELSAELMSKKDELREAQKYHGRDTTRHS